MNEEDLDEEFEGLNQEEYDDLLDQIYKKYNLKAKENLSSKGEVVTKGKQVITEKEKELYFSKVGDGKMLKSQEVIFIPLPKTELLIAREKFREMEEKEKEMEKKEKEKILEHLRLNSKNIGKPKKKRIATEDFVIYAPVNKKQNSLNSTPVTVQIRLLDSTKLNAIFQSDDYLTVVCDYIIQIVTENGKEMNVEYTSGFTLSIFKKIYNLEELQTKTLKDAGLCPRGIVYIAKDISGFKPLNQPSFIIYDKVIVPKYQLVGDTREEKEKFKEKMKLMEEESKKKEKQEEKLRREKLKYEINEKKKISTHIPTTTTKSPPKKELTEKQKKKKELEFIRMRMKEDRKERNEKNAK